MLMAGASVQEVMTVGDRSSDTVYTYFKLPMVHRVVQDYKISAILSDFAKARDVLR